jgi:metal-sulfur cluster biosynthetic enzyme
MTEKLACLEKIREEIIDYLREVYDPEISVNVYDLGLIYNIEIENLQKCNITMTLTSAFCPAADEIIADVHHAATRAVDECDVKVTFDPPFTPEMMSDEAKMLLGYF